MKDRKQINKYLKGNYLKTQQKWIWGKKERKENTKRSRRHKNEGKKKKDREY